MKIHRVLLIATLLSVEFGIVASIDQDPRNDDRWTKCSPGNRSLYDFEVEGLSGNKTALSEFRGKMLLIVNVATFCAYTEQYEDFNPMVNANENLHILAFPCNQFAAQEPGENHEILNGLKCVRPGNGWQPDANVHIFGKLEVNGKDEHPLYTYLKSACPPTGLRIGNPKYLMYNPIRTSDVTWNFEKFLVDEDGNLKYRYHPSSWNGGKTVQAHIDEISAHGRSAKH